MSENNLIERFHKNIDELIDINLCNRECYSRYKEFMSLEEWVHEFCTIRIDIGRRIGKSEYIKEHTFTNDCIVLRDYLSKNHYHDHMPGHIFVISQIEEMKGKNSIYNPQFIWIDDCDLNIMPVVYENFLRKDINQTFVVFGGK